MTEAEFKDTVAENLGILGSGQTLSAEDGAIILRRMTATFARLAAEEIVTVASTASIPDNQALALADIVAFDCAQPFSISGGKLSDMASFADRAIASLRLVTSERPYKDTLTQVRWWGAGRGGYYDGTG